MQIQHPQPGEPSDPAALLSVDSVTALQTVLSLLLLRSEQLSNTLQIWFVCSCVILGGNGVASTGLTALI